MRNYLLVILLFLPLLGLGGNSHEMDLSQDESASIFATKELRNPEPPMTPEPILPANNADAVNGEILRWNLPAGSAAATGYDVYIDDVVVSSNQAADRFTISGLALGAHTWYVVARNEAGTSASSATRSFTIVNGMVIGDGSSRVGLPISPHVNYSCSQSIFLQSEINVANHQIDKIAYYWDGAGVGDRSNKWVVYIGHTTRSAFTSGTDWVPEDSLITVYTSDIHGIPIPAVEGWIEITLGTPFVYNNTANLVIAVVDYNGGVNNTVPYPSFYSTNVDSYRSINTLSYNKRIYMSNPPEGMIRKALPNIRLIFSNAPGNPVLTYSPQQINFGDVFSGENSAPVNVSISNTGTGTLSLAASDISIIGAQASSFAVDTSQFPVDLTADQSINLPVWVTAQPEGAVNATLRIAFGGSNYDVALSANVIRKPDVIGGGAPVLLPGADGIYVQVQGTNLDFDPNVSLENLLSDPALNNPNLNSDNTLAFGFTGTGQANITFTITKAGTWFGMLRAGVAWHSSSPFGLIIPNDQNANTLTFSNVDFGAKGGVQGILSNGNNPTLPVELSHFSANVVGHNHVRLNWVSQSESNLLGYLVYRNMVNDADTAMRICELIPGSNTSSAQSYNYEDMELQQAGQYYYYWLQSVEMTGQVNYHGPVLVNLSMDGGSDSPSLPVMNMLKDAYPNPFNPHTVIPYSIKEPATVQIAIYNTKGQIVKCFSTHHAEAGEYKVLWDGLDLDNRPISSGIYLYRMTCGDYQSHKKMIMLK